MIRTQNLTVDYRAIRALDDVSLTIEPGTSVLLAGPSGCGKSTFARVITGLIPHAIPAALSGTAWVAGQNTRDRTIAELAEHVGVVFQNPSSQLFHLRVADEIAFGLRNHGYDEALVARRVDWALDVVGLPDFHDRRPAELSRGQQQRVAIASVLALQPSILVLDEPTASLDLPGTRQVLHTLHTMREQLGLTMILIEHRLGEVASLADRLVVLDEGRVVLDDVPHRLLSDADVLQRWGLRTGSREAIQPWSTLLQPPTAPASNGAAPLIEVRRAAAGYGQDPVIDDIDLALYPGEFTALVGDNGAGKSTLGLLIAGLLKPMQGQVRFQTGQKPRPGRDITLLFQNPADQLFTDTVEEEVAFGPRNYRMFDAERHRQTLAETDLLDLRARPPLTLSVGQQQRTTLAACLALRPQLIILDEPTAGQDWGHLKQLMDFLVELNQQGATVLLITHDYELVCRYARRVIVMQAGRITSEGHFRKEVLNAFHCA
jgi:energy-coupling factor transport system ATP-binding protein